LLIAVAARLVRALQMPAIFGDHMVLQRNVRAPLWGTGEPGETVTVQIGARKVSGRVGTDGRWMVRVGPFAGGGPHAVTVTAPSGQIRFQDIAFGEVWIASGQSNMEFPLVASRSGEAEVRSAANRDLRLFVVAKAALEAPASDCKGSWSVCSPESARGFSAVAYFFGRALHRRLQVPIGLIETAWGGTPAESWTARKWLEEDPILSPMLARIPPPGQTTKPDNPAKPAWDAWTPTSLYNGMIAPIAPYAAAGAIWYQGESNAGRAYQYRTLFPAMIRCWREAFGQPRLAFVWVQLANFMKRNPEPGDSAWAELREAQTMTLSLPDTGQAVAIEIGDANDIHPRNKQDVGMRLALQAQALAYGDRDLVVSGPMYKAMSVRGAAVTLSFTSVGGGLVSRDGLPLTGFAVAGSDRKFHWADARIVGDTVVVTSQAVAAPVAVRYAWADNPECNLANASGLPACPFRTDNWPGVTVDAR